ncbi:uncharacterized protein LOC106154946 [Lingula anatina]|uniref:Uncharacterized protein LOC106154946 n=1 Tax=Lingula anatina TaxID=7574 RepID=A0A1S3HFY8_LINAN|nr:uncharacterized protein LOC106154946 [Lingula anatina]|eukprot:XP_013384970.1 uncharacterized protein LOC106154946 [Lingula anatina]
MMSTSLTACLILSSAVFFTSHASSSANKSVKSVTLQVKDAEHRVTNSVKSGEKVYLEIASIVRNATSSVKVKSCQVGPTVETIDLIGVTILDSYCGTSTRGVFSSTSGFDGLTVDTAGAAWDVARSPLFSVFTFAGYDSLFTRCQVVFCVPGRQEACLTTNQCTAATENRTRDILAESEANETVHEVYALVSVAPQSTTSAPYHPSSPLVPPATKPATESDPAWLTTVTDILFYVLVVCWFLALIIPAFGTAILMSKLKADEVNAKSLGEKAKIPDAEFHII